MLYALIKAKNRSQFIVSNMKCLLKGLQVYNNQSTKTILFSFQTSHVTMVYLHLRIGCYLDYVITTVWSCAFFSHVFHDFNDGYTIVFMFVCKIVHVVFLEESYFLVFCSYFVLKIHTFIVDGLDPVTMVCDGLLQLCCPLMML